MNRYMVYGTACLLVIAIAGCTSQYPKAEPTKYERAAENVSMQQSDMETDINKTDINKDKLQSRSYISKPPSKNAEKDKVILDVPLIRQNPELKYGCEVTSLAMVLKYAGIETDKLELAEELPKDKDPQQTSNSGDITRWGNPDHGFVGDITGKSAGFAVYAGPLEKLMKHYLQDRTLNLTKKPFNDILAQIEKGKPVILWTTGDYKIPNRWETWKHEGETIRSPLDLHAVVLVGYDQDHLFLNDPLTGKKTYKTKKDSFLKSWDALGKQALSYD